MRRLRKRIRNFIDSTSGTAVIETAIVAPVLATVIMGVVDISSYAAAKLEVQQAINRGLELAMIGGPSTATTDIRDQTAAQAGVASDRVTVTQFQYCNNSTATWDTSCPSGQELKRFIQIDVSQSYSPTFVGAAFDRLLSSGTDGTISISARGVIRVQ